MASPELDAGPAWDAYWWCKANVLEEAECDFFFNRVMYQIAYASYDQSQKKKDK